MSTSITHQKLKYPPTKRHAPQVFSLIPVDVDSELKQGIWMAWNEMLSPNNNGFPIDEVVHRADKAALRVASSTRFQEFLTNRSIPPDDGLQFVQWWFMSYSVLCLLRNVVCGFDSDPGPELEKMDVDFVSLRVAISNEAQLLATCLPTTEIFASCKDEHFAGKRYRYLLAGPTRFINHNCRRNVERLEDSSSRPQDRY
ncbi:hypothetical protein VNI00_013680 [Paramarasmius palmivorus]|uniref:SET domain-containing protein n=1 Tax=Paramarasmius palmivorus TaxID=297713 RepID=A0AAW0BY23_9AGAR